MKTKTRSAGPGAGKFLIFAIAAILLMGCGKPKNENDPAQAAASEKKNGAVVQGDLNPVFAVNTTRAVKGEINDYIEINGDVQTKSSVDIYPDTTGKLTKLTISVGDRVLKDQVIAEVDPSRPGSNFVASPVKSPISGTITSIPVYVGSTITQGVPIARITTTDSLEIRTDVAERFISKMRVGLAAVLSFEAFPGAAFLGRVTELSPVVDPQTRTLEVKIQLEKAEARVKAGMFAAIKIITEKKEGVVKIPTDCLVSRFGTQFVFVVKEDASASTGTIVEKREVQTGIRIDNKLEILKGLAADEQIIIQGQTLLDDKSVVKVVGELQPLSSADAVK